MPRPFQLTVNVIIFIFAVVSVALAQTSPQITGQWTMGAPTDRDQVQLVIHRSAGNSHMSDSPGALDLSRFRGLTRAQFDSSGSLAHFELVRDAGTVRFGGYVQRAGGGGTFTFARN